VGGGSDPSEFSVRHQFHMKAEHKPNMFESRVLSVCIGYLTNDELGRIWKEIVML
jgi:hypothetical protein